MINIKHKNIDSTILRALFILSLFVSFVFIILKFNPSIGEDEPFTMALIHHSYRNMVYISSFDVHPPAYYLVLKTFLIITTFWTKSILIKIMFAKLLSVLFFIITFIELFSLLKLLHIDIDWMAQLVVYLSLVTTINYSLQIRMYEMALALLSVEIVHLTKFCNNYKLYNLVIAVISASIASYTHYFSAMFAGSLLLAFFCQEILHKHNKQALKILLGGIVFIILFIPCIGFATKQFIYVSSNLYNNNAGDIVNNNFLIQIMESISGSNIHNYGELLYCIIILISTIYFMIKILYTSNNKVKNTLFVLAFSFICSLILPLTFTFVDHPIIQGRYFYPISSIYQFLIIGFIIFNLRKINQSIIIKNLILILSFVIPFFALFKSISQFKNSDLKSINVYRKVCQIDNSDKKAIKLSTFNNFPEESVYLQNFKHIPVVKINHPNIKGTLGSNNKELGKKVFSNIHFKYS